MGKEVIVGLVNARHPLPVEKYIWDKVPDVLDFDAMDKHVCSWLAQHVGITAKSGAALNAADYGDTAVYEGEHSLTVYVTGLTACTASLVKMCALNGVSLTLMHYDKLSGGYCPQRIF